MKNYPDMIKIDDSPLAYFFAAKLANRMLPYAARYDINPNQITIISFLFGVVAALLYANGSRLYLSVGSVLLIISFIFDCLDGQLARYTGKVSAFGVWLDIFSDRTKELLLWICLSYGTFTKTGNNRIWMWGMIAIFALTLRFMEGLYRERAIGRYDKKPKTLTNGVSVSKRVWIQRLFYFSIAERTFLLTVAAPLGQAENFFKIMIVGNIGMMIVFSANGWWKARYEAFRNPLEKKIK